MDRRLHLISCAALVSLAAGCAYLARQATIVYMKVESAFSDEQVQVEIKRSFLEAYKNRVTIGATFTVDEAMEKALSKLLDGDLHFAGRAPEVALPLVGEIVNAGEEDTAVAMIQRAESTHVPIRVTGVWRLWPEHARHKQQEQGEPLPALESWNPDHSFEIHPVTRLGGRNLLRTLHVVDGFRAGSAERTFGIYENVECALTVTPKTVTLITPTGLYNDVHFVMERTREPQVVVADGRFVTAAARDLEGKLLVERLRLVFVKGSAAERAVRGVAPGGRLHVYGIPRVNFSQLSKWARSARGDSTTVQGKLPYEIIVIAVYTDD